MSAYRCPRTSGRALRARSRLVLLVLLVPLAAGLPLSATTTALAQAHEQPAGGPDARCERGSAGPGVKVCGFAALNVMKDSTQSFGPNAGNTLVQRAGTYQGNHDQLQFTARDSRLSFEAQAQEAHSVHVSGSLQMDFNGFMPLDATETEQYTVGPVRMRLAYLRLKSPVIDVVAGQYHDLFGWGGAGFYPATLAFLGVTGQVYHRQPQLRMGRTFASEAADFELAVAATRPVQKNSGVPDGQAGARLALNRWRGAAASGYGQPDIVPAGLGVSGLVRRFEVAEFLGRPADSYKALGWAFAANAVIPVIPIANNADRGNGLTLTAEFSIGTGASDMYSDLTGGALFPALTNDGSLVIPPIYQPDIDSGIVTFDANRDLQTINWRGFVLGAQYYLPIAKGRVWLTGIFSQLVSNNIVLVTPMPNRGNVFDKATYIDGSLFVAVTEQLQAGVSFQTVEQTFGDGLKSRNNRAEFGAHFFF